MMFFLNNYIKAVQEKKKMQPVPIFPTTYANPNAENEKEKNTAGKCQSGMLEWRFECLFHRTGERGFGEMMR